MMNKLSITLMGTGTSHGIPVIGCNCKVCRSRDSRNQRLRASAFITDGNTNIVIDTGPEFRMQAIRQQIKKLDAVLFTHDHADHMNGLDDVRIFSSTKHDGIIEKDPSVFDRIFKRHTDGIKVFANPHTAKIIRTHFDYIFKRTQVGGGKPRIDLWTTEKFNAENPIKIGNIKVIPIPMKHGKLPASGYLIYTQDDIQQRHSIAYLTDCNYISDKSINIIKENCGTLDHCIIDGLRERSHSTHFSFLEAMECAAKIQPEHTLFTHMTHDHSHKEIQEYISKNLKDFPGLKNVEPGYDQLTLVTQ